MSSTIILIGIMGLASIAFLLYALLPSKEQEQQTIQRRMLGKSSEEDTTVIQQKARESVTAKMMEKVAPIAMRPVMPKNSAEMSRLRIKLAAAGYRKDTAPTIFLTSKTVVGVCAGLAVGLYMFSRQAEVQQMVGMSVFAAAVGFLAPNMWLTAAMRKRGELIRNGLPDSLDLLVITVEAGLALDAALQRVGDEMRNVHADLSEEFQIATREVQMGIPRGEALENVAERTQLPEMRSLVAIVNQAEKFGTSVAKALRHQADALRVKRRQAAEERAQKTAVKLMAPLILFIFPAIFVVLAGPAALKMIEMAKNNDQLFG
ncbi:MAG: type II secretion system F family protein [Phycisphaerae bacterium]